MLKTFVDTSAARLNSGQDLVILASDHGSLLSGELRGCAGFLFSLSIASFGKQGKRGCLSSPGDMIGLCAP